MALIDDYKAAKVTRAQALVERDNRDRQLAAVGLQLEAQIADLVFTRLRPVAALSWLPDVDLTEACKAFGRSAMDSLDRPPPPGTP